MILRPKSGVRVIKIKGKPYQMGKERGEQLADIIRASVKRTLSSREGVPREKFHAVAEKFEDAINKKFPEIMDGYRGIADGAKVPYQDLIDAHLGRIPQNPKSPEYAASIARKYQPQFEVEDYPHIYQPPPSEADCSSLAATGPATSDGMPIITAHEDTDVETGLRILQTQCVIYVEPSDGYKYVDIVNTGFLGQPSSPEGFNEKGLAICGSGAHNNDGWDGYEKGKPVGVPLILLQSIIYRRCETVDDAIEYLKMTPKGYGGRNLNVVDTKGGIVKTEITYEHVNIIWPHEHATYPANWCFAGTSHLASKELNRFGLSPEEYPSSYKRFDRYMELLTEYAGKIDFDIAKRIIRDHKNGPGAWSICRHGPVYTWTSYIIQPAAKRCWIVLGRPCLNEYEPFYLK